MLKGQQLRNINFAASDEIGDLSRDCQWMKPLDEVLMGNSMIDAGETVTSQIYSLIIASVGEGQPDTVCRLV